MERFQYITEELLWIMKRSRPELETPVSFLCRRVLEKMIEYWGKLRKLLVFLKDTKNDQRNLGMDDY